MEYLKSMQSGLQSMLDAAETGRTNVEGMVSPLNGAVRSMTDAASSLESIPFVGPAIGAKLQRVTRVVAQAQQRINTVIATAARVTQGVQRAKEAAGKLGEQVARAKAAVGKLAAKVSPEPVAVVPTAALAPEPVSLAQAVSAQPHLLIAQPLDAKKQAYHFGLETAAFDSLTRSAAYRWASQERLGRRPAQQAVGMGDEKISIKGSIFPGFKGGIGQLDALRTIGGQLEPLLLTTGYGQSLGTWCLVNINEEQEHLMPGGIPAKQGFSLEFVSYGDDL